MTLCFVLIRNMWASLQILLTIAMILGNLLGVMAMWGINLNGIQLFNSHHILLFFLGSFSFNYVASANHDLQM
jgi:hypothetical protein